MFRSDELFTQIKYVLGIFSPPYLAFFLETDKLVDAHVNDAATLKVLFQAIFLMTKIFLSLNAQDLPEFFEEHQEEFMSRFQKYLQYKNPLLETDEEEVGPIEKVKASICEIIDMYAIKYEDDFKKLPEFVQIVWNLLKYF